MLRKSHMLPMSVLPPPLVTRLAEFAQCVVHEKLVTNAHAMCISAPHAQNARAEVLLNTKIAVQYSMDRWDSHLLTPIKRKCARCRGSNEEDTPGSCCPMGSSGCAVCVGCPYVCPVLHCNAHYVRRWTYETGSGRSTVGRNRAQFKVLPFTSDMHSMVEQWNKLSPLPYNNIVLVTYCGADMCAHCACGLREEHGSIQCASVLHMHQDNGQGGANYTTPTCAVNRTLNVGDSRTLSMELVKHLGGPCQWTIPGSEVQFELKHGSEFILDTVDEVEGMRDTRTSPTRCSWTHGMVTPVRAAGISCGFVARNVTMVRDVNLHDDVVIDAQHDAWQCSDNAAQMRRAEQRWHELCPSYVSAVQPRVEAALQSWGTAKLRNRHL